MQITYYYIISFCYSVTMIRMYKRDGLACRFKRNIMKGYHVYLEYYNVAPGFKREE